jgi:hypothetical protein
MANSYLNRTPSSTGNRRTFTISVWLKRSRLGSPESHITNINTGNNPYGRILFKTDDTLRIDDYEGSQDTSIITNRKFRDTNAWYHIVVAYDTTQSTASNRIKIYVNGVQETSFSTETYPAQNFDTEYNKASAGMEIGKFSSNYFEGYMSHFALVDGQQLAPTVFGETDSTSGIWKFKQPSGVTWGTNGFHLKFENSGALGTDSSGNTNTFTVNGNLKQAVDTPTNVYNTLNPLSTDSGVTLSNGNTESDFDGSVGNAKGTLGFSSGKWYWEVKIAATTGSYPMIGIGSLDEEQMQKTTGGSYPGGFTNSYGGYGNGAIYANGSNTGSQSFTWGANDIIGIAVDLDSATKTIKWYKNGNATAIATYNITTVAPFTSMDYNGAEAAVNLQYNFGNGYFGTTAITSAGSNGNGSLFEYDVPSGYYALNTKNINTYG